MTSGMNRDLNGFSGTNQSFKNYLDGGYLVKTLVATSLSRRSLVLGEAFSR